MSRAEFESIAEFLLKRLPVTAVRNTGDGRWELTCTAELGDGLSMPFTVNTDEHASTATFSHTLDFAASGLYRPEVARLLDRMSAGPNGVEALLDPDSGELRLVAVLPFEERGQPAADPQSMLHALVEALALMGPALHAVAVEGRNCDMLTRASRC